MQVNEEQAFIQQFFQMYRSLDKNNLHMLDKFYAETIEFTDPLHQIKGLVELKQYFSHMYQNVEDCDFLLKTAQVHDGTAFIEWQMMLTHKTLAKGELIRLEGISVIKFKQEKIYSHRDYFDLSLMLFDQIPVIKRISGYIKRKASEY
ncbi:nuclear transport factor 2 family protein [Catenovulum sediminis]|uniref:Nuclear transport factor 2 family protein n=1 Tax=Catenovulum sediminis TaxID=1740262 RepID=A0ABV1RKV7_9ALTE